MSFMNKVFNRLSRHQPHPCDEPFIPVPPNGHTGFDHQDDIAYSETEINIDLIAGTSMAFGSEKTVMVDAGDWSRDIQKPSLLTHSSAQELLA